MWTQHINLKAPIRICLHFSFISVSIHSSFKGIFQCIFSSNWTDPFLAYMGICLGNVSINNHEKKFLQRFCEECPFSRIETGIFVFLLFFIFPCPKHLWCDIMAAIYMCKVFVKEELMWVQSSHVCSAEINRLRLIDIRGNFFTLKASQHHFDFRFNSSFSVKAFTSG